jgi:biotin carboxylase
MSKHIFVVGLDEFNLRLLRRVRHARGYEFHGLLEHATVARDPDCDVAELLVRGRAIVDTFPGKVSAIVGFWDFPTVLMMPILRRHVGLPGPTLESVLRCEHKYWARLLQREVLPEIVPPFAVVDPFESTAAQRPPLDFPFWIKPVKAHSSLLGFKVRDAREYAHALATIRAGIGQLARSLDAIMGHADLPAEIAAVDGYKCIAEGIISAGRQCTLEGYVLDGRPEVYGVVDSVRGPNRSSFARYQYPSTLPERVRQRMIDAATRLISHTGLDRSPFNMEFFWNRATDRIWVLETNARISKSHSPLFDKVEGVPHNEVMIDVALGRQPEYPLGLGAFTHAAKFMLRDYHHDGDALVAHAPDAAQVRAIEARFPGCEINPHIRSGMRLAELGFQDSYSHEFADIFVGANSQRALMRTYRVIVRALDIRIEAR